MKPSVRQHILLCTLKMKSAILCCHLVASILKSGLERINSLCKKPFTYLKKKRTLETEILPFSLLHMTIQKQLLLDEGQNALMKKVLDTYLLFFQINQSTATLRHVFAGLRLFVQKVQQDSCNHITSFQLLVSFFSHRRFHLHLLLQFPSAFFQGKADLCGCLCYEILKCCNHRSSSTQTEAAALLYFFMRKNFEFTKGKSIVRSHLQVSESTNVQVSNQRFSVTLLLPTYFHFRLSRQ